MGVFECCTVDAAVVSWLPSTCFFTIDTAIYVSTYLEGAARRYDGDPDSFPYRSNSHDNQKFSEYITARIRACKGPSGACCGPRERRGARRSVLGLHARWPAV